MKYEGNIKELEKIVNKLNVEQLSLDESIQLYSVGINLAKESLEELNTVKGKIEVLNCQLKELEIDIEDDE